MVKNPLPPEIKNLTYEEAYQQLEAVIKSLETGDQPLDEALALFETGQKLVLHCMTLLDAAELRVKQVTENGLIDFENEN